MAKKISSTDLFEKEDIFEGVRLSAQKTIEQLNQLDAEFKGIAASMKASIGGAKFDSTKSVNEFINSTKQANQLMEESIKIEKMKAQADQQMVKAEQEKEKLAQQRLKTEQAEIKARQQAEQAAKKQAIEQAKLAKIAENEGNAYKQLEKKARDLKNESKQLGAEMLKLEQAGMRNSAEYSKVSQQYEAVTADAQKMDQQLKSLDKTVGDNYRNVGNYEGAVTNLKKELRQLTQELMNMDEADPRFQEMAQRAGELKDQIQDTQAVVKATAGSAVENFGTAFAKAGQLGVAGAQGITASMQLLGVESEGTLQAIAKLQALGSLADSFQALGGLKDTLTEISAGLTAAATKTTAWVVGKTADTAATSSQTTAQVANTAAVEANTVASEGNIAVTEAGNVADEVSLAVTETSTIAEEANAVATGVNTAATEAQGVAMVATTVATTGATTAMKLLRIALITSGIGAIIVLLGLAAEAMGLFSDETESEEEAQKKLEKETKQLEKQIESYRKTSEAVIATIDRVTRSELALAKQRGASAAELQRINRESLKQKITMAKFDEEEAKRLYLKYSKSGSTEQFEKAEKNYLDALANRQDAELSLLELDADIAQANRENAKSNASNAQSTADAIAGVSTEFSKLNAELSKSQEFMQRLLEQAQNTKLQDAQRNINYTLTETINAIKAGADADVTAVEDAVKAKFDLERLYADQRLQYEIDVINERYKLDIQAKRAALEEEKKALVDSATKQIKDVKARDKKIQEIEKNYAIRQEELNAYEVQLNKDKELEINIAKNDGATARTEIAQKEGDEINRVNDAVFDAQKKTIDEQTKLREDEAKRELELLRKTEEQKREIARMTAEIFTKNSQKRVEQIDKEIEASQKQYDELKRLADEGNITAQQSLAEQQRIIDEANLKKEREQKRQQRIKLAESIYSTYSQKVEAGSKNPLAETIRDTTLLQQFISSLPTFFDGTEDTGLNGRGVDGKGGFHAILHPNERVIPKSLNDKIGTLSNTELAKVAQEYQNGKFMEGATQSASALEFSLLVNEIKDLKQVIRDKPESNIGLGEITQSMVEIVEKRVRGNNVTYNRFKVRK
jgi:hypothetical protein